MNLEQLSQLGEFVGGIAVIISLIYLALQVRSNTVAQRSDIEARALERLGSMQHEMAANSELTTLHNRAMADIYSLDFNERVRITWWLTEYFSAMEFLHDQHRRGSVSEGIWWRWDRTFRWWLTFPGILVYWQCKPTPFSPAFSDYVEASIKAGYEHERPGAWDALVEGEPFESD